MSELTTKYGSIYELAEELGCEDLEANEEDGHMTISAVCPTAYISNQLWDKAKELDPGLDDGDLTLDLSVERDDIYGEYEVKKGDTLSSIAKKITHGKLSYQDIFEENSDILDDANKISPGQVLRIPNF